MASFVRFFEKELVLLVNQEKSEVARINGVTFLGFRVERTNPNSCRGSL